MGWNSESEVVLLTLDEADMCRKWAPGMDDSIPVFYLRCVFQEACERLNRLKPKQIVPRCHSDSESLEAAPCCFYQTGKCRFRDGKCDYEHVKSNVCHFSVYRGYCTSGHAGLDQNRVGDFEFPVLTVREVFFAFKGKDIRPFPSWTSGGVLSFFRDDSFHLPLFGMNFSVYGFFKPDPASKRRKFKDDEDDNDDLAFFGVRDIRKADQKIKAAKLEMAVRSYKLSKVGGCLVTYFFFFFYCVFFMYRAEFAQFWINLTKGLILPLFCLHLPFIVAFSIMSQILRTCFLWVQLVWLSTGCSIKRSRLNIRS